ncbi:(E)-4-hydroxy-3-methylbut-2-enyl-diphosphate synthase [Flavobacteriales bacterium]|nr:4-hydroxy-3-methylbut-2-en-1-yl diphosphate synthase (ferredoxin) [Flavobacteriales bacterium]CAG0964056.1 (E)-4-hydroxy-3-methylbut-2-enyl-diphosphate synthase [Flavobacteriales bacterium]
MKTKIESAGKNNIQKLNTVYCHNLTAYTRWKTREVKVGNIGIGDKNPIRIQSMTTTDTMNTKATVEQSIRMIEAGCELVRITAPSVKEAENLLQIKNELRKRGYQTPLVADIHYTPNAAELAARIVEKVRINPGNYVDKKKFEIIEYTESAYRAELERIRDKFLPLVRICKKHGTAMRIGTNHGSLSDRILSRYGDTPTGMVESAMEFLKICEDEQYHNIVLSMKASNTQVMVQAYRLLAHRMMQENMNYPLHLGVTEAGDGEDGRIKSAVGIGALLEDGLGDTIRVSLTEDPECEIPVAKKLVGRYDVRSSQTNLSEILEYPINPFEYTRRKSHLVFTIGGNNVPRVIANYSHFEQIHKASLYAVGYHYSVPNDKWNLNEMACDFIFAGDCPVTFDTPGTLGIIYNYQTWVKEKNKERRFPLLSVQEFINLNISETEIIFIELTLHELSPECIDKLRQIKNCVILVNTSQTEGIYEQRKAFTELMLAGIPHPVIIKRNYFYLSNDTLTLYAASDFGSLLTDGLGDGIWINASECGGTKEINSVAFGILQATRTRISKTEYISCPSCGRTLFDLQETTAKIRAVTNHLKGVKIGIMGCIVNGPGEMADADYGYVGTGAGRITLYKQKNVVERNIPEKQAVEALIALIKENGDWIEPPTQ